MARATLNTGQENTSSQGTGTKKPNAYVGGMWVKEEGGKQRLSYIVKSEEDKQKLKDHLDKSIESGESFILYGIENSYKNNNPKAPHFVLLVPSPKQD